MNINLFFSLCLAVGLWACGARANDANASGIGGRWQMMGGKHPQVQMVREHVRIVPSGALFQTTADFVFRNLGPATTVTMGFPESAYGSVYEGRRPEEEPLGFRRFRSWVDGRRASVVRRVSTSDEGNFVALWTKTVRFAAHQTRRVRVRYLSRAGSDSSGHSWVSYDFTGGNWRGEVEESLLDVELPPSATLAPASGDEKVTLSQARRTGNWLHFRWTHWQAQQRFELSFIAPSHHLSQDKQFALADLRGLNARYASQSQKAKSSFLAKKRSVAASRLKTAGSSSGTNSNKSGTSNPNARNSST